jgi:hypothetical protein
MEIMKELIDSDPKSPYVIEKKLNIPHATLSSAFKELSNKELIEVAEEKIFKTSLKTRKFKVTLKGLLYYLSHYVFDQNEKEFSKLIQIDEIILKYKAEYWLFEEWFVIKDINAKELKDFILFAILKSSLISTEHSLFYPFSRSQFIRFLTEILYPSIDVFNEKVNGYTTDAATEKNFSTSTILNTFLEGKDSEAKVKQYKLLRLQTLYYLKKRHELVLELEQYINKRLALNRQVLEMINNMGKQFELDFGTNFNPDSKTDLNDIIKFLTSNI